MRQRLISSFFKNNEADEAESSSEPVAVELPVPEKLVASISSKNFSYDSKADSKNDYIGSPQAQLNHEKYASKLKDASRRHGLEAPNGKRRKKNQLTPLEAQIVDLKKQHQDKILAINVGYKYKFFGPDARVCASILNIMLIPGKESLDNENPNDQYYDKLAYCSIPDTRLHVHLRRLISQGHKVGVVEQTEDAAIKLASASKNSLFERKLTDVYTCSTYVELEGDDFVTKGGNSIVSIVEDGSFVAIVSLNPLSAEIVYDVFEDNILRTELDTRLSHFQPSECVIRNDISQQTRQRLVKMRINTVESGRVDYLSNLQKYFAVTETFEFVKSLNPVIYGCFWLLIDYLKEFKLDVSFQVLENYHDFSAAHCMILNSNVLESLDIFCNSTNGKLNGSLLQFLDHTRSVLGFRLLKKWIGKPLVDRRLIEERLEAVENILVAMDLPFIEVARNLLNGLPDLEKYISRIHYRKAKRKELYTFLESVGKVLTTVKNRCTKLSSFKSPLLNQCRLTLVNLANENSQMVLDYILMINSEFAFEEDKARFFSKRYTNFHEIQKVNERIEACEIELSQELIKIKKQFKRPHMEYKSVLKEHYLVELSRSTKVPDTWVKINETKTAVRYRSPEIKVLLKSLNYENAMLLKVCDQEYQNFLQAIDEKYVQFSRIIKQLALIDCLLSIRAATSSRLFVRPSFVDLQIISVKQGRNPIIESLIYNYIPNDVNMRYQENRGMILTGPNMGGKSSYVRQVALIVIMAQIGCFVPAKSAILGVFDSVFTRMGFNDNLLKGESTFMVEMRQCNSILEKCTDRSLVILDEIGRGTGTTDGVAIAYSIINYLMTEIQPLLICITHFTQLSIMASQMPKVVKNYHMDYMELQDEGSNVADVVFLYKLVKGHAKNSFGLNVAKLALIPPGIIEEAYAISKLQENKMDFNKQVSWTKRVQLAVESNDLKQLLLLERQTD